MSMKRVLMKAARSQKQKKEVERMSEEEARQVLANIVFSMEKTVYTVYAPNNDMTFIMEDTYNNNEVISTECVGWYLGEPNDEATQKFIGKLKAEF